MNTIIIKYLIFLFFIPTIFASESIVIKHFQHTAKEITSLGKEFQLKLEGIQIEVVDKQLLDNRGSIVDAIGIPGKITLNLNSWLEFYQKGIDIRLLTLHEILRANGIDDDDFKVSLPLMSQAYLQNEERREDIPYCNLHIKTFEQEEIRESIKAHGYANTNPNVFIYPSPEAKISYSNAITKANQKCKDKGYLKFIPKSATVEKRNSNTNGFIKSFFRTSIKGNCIKQKRKRISASQIKKQMCEISNRCERIIAPYPNTAGKTQLKENIRKMKKESGCK